MSVTISHAQSNAFAPHHDATQGQIPEAVLGTIHEAVVQALPERPSLFSSKEEYPAYRAWFKGKAHAKALLSRDMLLHAALVGRDPHAAFGRTTNPTKLANGCIAEQGLKLALLDLRWIVRSKHHTPDFKAWLSEATLARAMASLEAMAAASKDIS